MKYKRITVFMLELALLCLVSGCGTKAELAATDRVVTAEEVLAAYALFDGQQDYQVCIEEQFTGGSGPNKVNNTVTHTVLHDGGLAVWTETSVQGMAAADATDVRFQQEGSWYQATYPHVREEWETVTRTETPAQPSLACQARLTGYCPLWDAQDTQVIAGVETLGTQSLDGVQTVVVRVTLDAEKSVAALLDAAAQRGNRTDADVTDGQIQEAFRQAYGTGVTIWLDASTGALLREERDLSELIPVMSYCTDQTACTQILTVTSSAAPPLELPSI